MPLYTYRCDIHGVFDYFCSYDDRDIPRECPHKLTNGSKISLDSQPYMCGRLSQRIPHRVSVQPCPYAAGDIYDAQLGRPFTRKSERQEYMRNPEINRLGVFEETMSTDKFSRPSMEEQATEKYSTPELERERESCIHEAIKEVEQKRGTTMQKALKAEAKERARGST